MKCLNRGAFEFKAARSVLFVCALVLTCQPTAAQEAAVAPESAASLRATGLRALQQEDVEAGKAAADELVKQHPANPRAAIDAADLYLRSGNWDPAVEQYERFLTLAPEQMPYLWQRGIALYFAGKFDLAAEQFEKHRVVNPNDVENAAWHFLCVAKAKSPEQAKKLLLPAPGDRRIPMAQILNMLSTGQTEPIIRAVAASTDDGLGSRDARLYRDLYLGLYADALGNDDQARKLMQSAATDAPHHYMGDVARVYAKYLKERKSAEQK